MGDEDLNLNLKAKKFSGSGRDGYDAIVIGSGYGGSVAACRLSQAGIRVCLLEKGRKWHAHDFPANTFQTMLATRVETKNFGCYGSKTALFQVYEQGDSLAMLCTGLGGGSLVNAGVMAPTPMRARRDPRWPKEWERSWSSCQARALNILQPEMSPHEFPNSKVMKGIAEEIEESTLDPIELTVKFKGGKSSAGLPQNACTACGNCLSGCSYNAKGSTDKNYLALAIQAGCEVKTECQVRYIVPNLEENLQSCCRSIDKSPKRRWRVHLDEVEYLSSDFVILSAGVLGTAEILFQSRKRGLGLSERLGLGLSSNGNNVAYVAGSSAPLNGYGLNNEEFVKVAKQDRPGPSITTSYTSSLGFTIQSGILPAAYPYLLFKGSGSYGWPEEYWFLHGIIDKFKRLAKTSDSQAIILNMMGFDKGDGTISLDERSDRIQFCPPQDPLLPRKIKVFQRLAKRLGGILFMSRFRSTSVHLLGGCNAAETPSMGVTNPSGQLFNPYSNVPQSQKTSKSEYAVHSGLYVCDASLIPCAIGINPSLTISTVAEYVAVFLVHDALKYKISMESLLNDQHQFCAVERKMHTPANGNSIPSGHQVLGQNEVADAKFLDKTVYPEDKNQLQSTVFNEVMKNPEKYDNTQMLEKDGSTIVRETMNGKLGGMPCTLYLVLKMNPWVYKDFNCKNRECAESHPLLRGQVGGYLKMKSLHREKLHILDGSVNMCYVNPRTPYTQYMHYHLLLSSASGARYILEGKKIMHPFLFGFTAWRESTTLHVNLRQITCKHQDCRLPYHNGDLVELEGVLKVSAFGLLRCLITLRGSEKGKFLSLLIQSLIRTYILQRPRNVPNVYYGTIKQSPYPGHVLEEITAGDGFPISCKHWKCSSKKLSNFPTTRNPVLLLNGHSTESFCLPTEPIDLVRTLLAEGYETWLLQPRMHPLHSSNKFTIEDIARYDIPAALARVAEIHGADIKVHVIAHCVGGLAIHMALLGGYISSHNVASLVCTNSSMFFKVTTTAFIKLMLPLIPISMAILGKNTVLQMSENSEGEWRYNLLKSIARIIPRSERCILDECEVFSGIFGSTLWHDNISTTMHHWLYKEAVPRLPMADFPHLRSICIAGHIVDSKGNNNFLIHPERIPLPTTYISGGRSLLVTPQTSLLANQYMKLHHPNFHHERVVVKGFGHSDLLVGENSHKHVFPHILSHLIRAEECSQGCKHIKDSSFSQPFNYEQKSLSFFVSYKLVFYIFLGFFLFHAFASIFTSTSAHR